MKYVIPQIPNVAFYNVFEYFLKEYSYNVQFFTIFYCNIHITIVFTKISK